MNSVLVVFTSILSSGILAAAISASLADDRDRRVLRRQKIEEIYLSTSDWLTDVQSTYLVFLKVAEGAIDYNKALEIQQSGYKSTSGDMHRKMKMNIEMYEHPLVPALRKLKIEQEELNHLNAALRNCYKEQGQAAQFEEPFRQQLLRFGKAGDGLLAAIVERGVVIGSEPGLFWRALSAIKSIKFRPARATLANVDQTQ